MTININSGIGNVTQFGELSTLAVADQNGYGAGILQSILCRRKECWSDRSRMA